MEVEWEEPPAAATPGLRCLVRRFFLEDPAAKSAGVWLLDPGANSRCPEELLDGKDGLAEDGGGANSSFLLILLLLPPRCTPCAC